MREPAVAPSAQRLAEENNVNWRALRGSGDGGSVVERDVLAYLTRVMRGEEATDPTPEPLPGGVSAWLEELERRPSTPQTSAPPSSLPPDDPLASPFTVPDAPPAETEPDDGPSPWTFGEPKTAAPDGGTERLSAAGASAQFFGAVAERPMRGPGVVVVRDGSPDAPLAELTTLEDGLESLEGGGRHADELHQSRLQETLALQKTELGALRDEVEGLKEALGRAQREAEREVRRAEALAAHNRDLEARLGRARAFKAAVRTEFDALTGRNVALEAELAALKRPWWKVWG